jgi:formylmethanofuran dehydrogenase subunit E
MENLKPEKIHQIISLWVLVNLGLLVLSCSAWAGDCARCHAEQKVKVTVPDSAPVELATDDGIRRISLEDAFNFHGHECPGITTAFIGFRYGLKLLFPDELPRPDDILIVSRTSAGGIKDMIDLIMKGANPATRSWPPVGLGNGKDRFDFIMIRKSTSELLALNLRREVIPADFFTLKQKQKQDALQPDEEQRLHDIIKQMILEFPLMAEEKLFGTPQAQKIMLWGTVAPREQDRHIWKQRQEEKKRLKARGE